MRKHLTYANVMATLAVVLVVAGGTAYAANTIGSSDIINGQVKSADIGTGQVLSIDVKSEGLTGEDIADQSGVDTCTHGTARLGELCVGVANENHTWMDATRLCANLDLRLPTLGEAFAVATNFDLPNVDEGELFWTDEYNTNIGVWLVTDGAGFAEPIDRATSHETVCVTTPTN